jgi:hypothetical protein
LWTAARLAIELFMSMRIAEAERLANSLGLGKHGRVSFFGTRNVVVDAVDVFMS